MGIRKGENEFNCRFCKVPETVDHFLMKCPGVTNPMHEKLNRKNANFDLHRWRLQKELRKISISSRMD